MNFWAWSFLVPFLGVCIWIECLELPVFAPNDYFWKHHWDGKNEEDKWKVFADAVREEMAKAGDLKLSDARAEDKVDYKDLVWGKGGMKHD